VIDARVRASGDLGEVLNVARAWGVEGTEGMSGSGPLSLDVTATGPIDALNFAGRGSLTSASLTTPALTQPVAIKTAQLAFTRDSPVIERLIATVGKTTASATARQPRR
jgi:hypothetical protein